MSIYDHIDHLRLVPRLVLAGYAWLVYVMCQWFMTLPDPTGNQSLFVGAVIGASAGVFGLYVNSGRKQ